MGWLVPNVDKPWALVHTRAVAGRLFLVSALAVALAVVVVGACSPQPIAVIPSPSPTPVRTPATAVPAVSSPSPTASPTASPSPSPAPTGATGTPPPVACPAQTGGSASSGAQLTGVRAAHQPGFDRIVFEFGPSTVASYGLPAYDLSVVSQFIATSGRPVPIDGNAFLQARFRNASTVDPTTGQQTFTQTDIHPGLPLVREVKLVDDFERIMTWGIGLDHLICAKVSELAGPVRLVVDLPTPP